jgi:hypothetical protein
LDGPFTSRSTRLINFTHFAPKFSVLPWRFFLHVDFLEALLPVWQNAVKMSVGENRFSVTRAQSKPAARQEAIS